MFKVCNSILKFMFKNSQYFPPNEKLLKIFPIKIIFYTRRRKKQHISASLKEKKMKYIKNE
jgi:hypothetical protein